MGVGGSEGRRNDEGGSDEGGSDEGGSDEGGSDEGGSDEGGSDEAGTSDAVGAGPGTLGALAPVLSTPTDVGSTIWKNVDLSITGRFPWVPGVSQRDDSPSNNVLTLTAAVNLAGLAGREVYWDAVFVRPGCC